MNNHLDTKQLRSFGLIVGGIFALIGLWPVVFRSQDPRLWAFVLAALLITPALLAPRSLKLAYRVWMAIGHALGWINTKVILGILFYSMFMPIGLIMRLLAKDPMGREFDPAATTYRILRQPRHSSHMKHQF